MKQAWLAVGLLLATLLLSGCSGTQGGPAQAEETGSSSSSPAPANATNLTALRFPASGPVRTTLWANGSFNVADSCNTGGCTTGAYRKTTSLEGLIPPATPTLLRLELTYADSPTPLGSPLLAEVDTGDAIVYNSTLEIPRQGLSMRGLVLVKGQEPVAAAVAYYNPQPVGPAVAYTLRIDIDADPEVTPASVPVVLPPLSADAELQIQPISGPRPIRFEVFDVAGGVHRFENGTGTASRVPLEEAGAGPFVLIATEEMGSFQLLSRQAGAGLAAAGFEVQLGPAHSIAAPQPLAWRFELASAPLSVGLYARPTTTLWVQAQESPVQISSAKGILLSGRFGCGTCITGGQELLTFGTDFGDPRLDPGGYEATFDATGSAGIEVGHYAVFLKR